MTPVPPVPHVSPAGRSPILPKIPTDARDEALDLLRAAVTKSRRPKQVPFGKPFLRTTDKTTPPLARLIQGGRGGEVRLKLYLTITMMATGYPHDLRRPPPPNRWAQLLALTSPTASRRISSNLRWLHNNKFIELTPRAGHLPLITLLDPAGSGGPYVRPLPSQRYISLPLELWNQGWILELSATALALLMVIRDVQQNKALARYAPRQDRAAYHLSPDTWTRASKELVGHELLEILRLPQGGEFDYERMRNLYRVNTDRLMTPPAW